MGPSFRDAVSFVSGDVRGDRPEGPFHLILCRNLVFTYYDEPLQSSILTRMASCLAPDGVLVIGIHEALPDRQTLFRDHESRLGIYARKPDA